MSKELYSVVFNGELQENVRLEDAKKQLSEKFNLNPEQVDRMFAARRIRVRKLVGLVEAKKFQKVFESTGVICYVKKEQQVADGLKKALTPKLLSSHFKGNIGSIRPGFRYQAGLFATAFAVLFLPLIYASLIAVIVWATYSHAVHNIQWLDGRNPVYSLFGYVTLLVMGLTACLFLLKPFFYSHRRQYGELELKPKKEPLLFEFVNQIADLVHAPRPEVIVVNMQVNAAASFYDLSGKSKRATLFLGMPLFAGFDMRQLAGVLAHEFGHFSQGWGMRTTYLIRVINYWFYRAVYERDALDEKLEKIISSKESWLKLPFLFASLVVDVQRSILARLLRLAEIISQHMLREMEFDADQYEVRLAGSHYFRETSFKLRLLNRAFDVVMSELRAVWEERRLVDDLPALILKKADECKSEWRPEIEREMQESPSSIFDSHPGDIHRIQRAEAEKVEGVFHLTLPARQLLNEYERLVKLATIRFYRGDLGLAIKEDQLISAENASATVQQVNERTQALEDYFRDYFMPWRCMQFNGSIDIAGQSLDKRKQRLQQLVAELRQSMPDIRNLQHKYDKLLEDMPSAYLQLVVQQARIPWPYSEPWRGPDFSDLKATEARIIKEYQAFDQLMSERLMIGLQGYLEGQSDGQLVEQQLTYLQDFLSALHHSQEAWHQLYLNHLMLENLTEIRIAAEQGGIEQLMISEHIIDMRLRYVQENINQIETIMGKVTHPFKSVDGWVSVMKHIMEKMPPSSRNVISDTLSKSAVLLENLPDLNRRAMGALATMAAQFEAELGVDPIRVILKKRKL